MTKKIKILPLELRNRIAAGEVVERPASALKELIENSLDAGARSVEVHIERGGQGLILVQDNGQGMDAEEMELALNRHATSKINNFNDLFNIASYGFRGEALPSIASISRLSLASTDHETGKATGIEVEFGRIIQKGPVALTAGTRVEVRDLFTNIPARLKFLKSPATERDRCKETFFRLCLASLDTAFNFNVDGRQTCRLNAGQSLKERLATFWPPSITNHMQPFSYNLQEDGIHIHGLLGDPKSRQQRAGHMLFYVNNRAINDRMLLKCAKDAYKGRLLGNEYPQLVVFIDLPPDMIDVNVHPAKSEVRFKDQSLIFTALRKAMQNAIPSFGVQLIEQEKSAFQEASRREEAHFPEPTTGPQPVPPFQQRWPNEEVWTFRNKKGAHRTEFAEYFPQKAANVPAKASTPPETGQMDEIPPWEVPDRLINSNEAIPHHAENRLAPLPSTADSDSTAGQSRPTTSPAADNTVGQLSNLTYIGQFALTYLILSGPQNNLIILDQHAIHERILYEQLKSAEQSGKSRPLLLPVELSLHPAEAAEFEKLHSELKNLGFDFDRQEQTLKVTAAPAFLDSAQIKTSLSEFLAGQDPHIEDKWKTLACRGAVKATHALTANEAWALIKAWQRTIEPDHCPHGRPVAVVWPLADIEKLFKRK